MKNLVHNVRLVFVVTIYKDNMFWVSEDGTGHDSKSKLLELKCHISENINNIIFLSVHKMKLEKYYTVYSLSDTISHKSPVGHW